MSKAYLAGGVNQALVSREEGLYVLDGATQHASKLDSYVFSQWRLSRQEIKEIDVEQDAEIFEELYIASVQATALQEALELMDDALSFAYRTKIAGLLTERIKVHTGLLDYLTNRFYSNRLPDEFDEKLALDLLDKAETPLYELYEDLRKKTDLFDIFYTRFWFKLQLEDTVRTRIDELLTADSVYAHFTNALYTRSSTLYDYAAALAMKTLEKNQIAAERDLFSELRSVLSQKDKLFFKDELQFEKLLRDHWMINVQPYRFFGSAVKTIYNYSNALLPFSTEQTVQVLLDTHSPLRLPGEAETAHKQKIYWQSVNDLEFFASVGEQVSLPSPVGTVKLDEVRRCVRMIYDHRNSYQIRIEIDVPASYLERYTALIYADCTFLRQDFDDAVLLYTDLHADFDKSWKRYRDYDHLMMNSNVMVRLGKSYDMLNERKKASNYYRKAYRMITDFIARMSEPAYSEFAGDDDEDVIYREPSHLEYAEAVAGKLAGLLGAVVRVKGR